MKSMNIYEKYRPRRLAQIVGQDRAVGVARRACAAGLGGKAFWVSGKSGQGKSTLVRAMASTMADEFFVQELDASTLTPARLAEIEQTMGTFGWGLGGRAFIVNEAHGLRKDTVRALLVVLERLPSHCAWFFTTTTDGMALFEDGQLDASPLLSRCVPITLTSQGVAGKFAALVARIASRENLNGQPIGAYVKLANECKGNCRAMLQAVEAGIMVEATGLAH